MEIIKNFGVDPVLLAAQIVNFLILVYLFKRFFLKKIVAFLKEREDKIKAGLEAAQKGEQLLAQAKITQKEIAKEAREEAKKLLVEAGQKQESLANRVREDTQREVQRMLEEAKKSAIEEGMRVQKELEGKIASLAISILEKTLKSVLTEEENKKIVSNLYKKVKVVQ